MLEIFYESIKTIRYDNVHSLHQVVLHSALKNHSMNINYVQTQQIYSVSDINFRMYFQTTCLNEWLNGLFNSGSHFKVFNVIT